MRKFLLVLALIFAMCGLAAVDVAVAPFAGPGLRIGLYLGQAMLLALTIVSSCWE